MTPKERAQETGTPQSTISEALQSDAMIHVLTRATMEHLTIAPQSLLEKALVPQEQVVLGLVTALFSHGNKSRWNLIASSSESPGSKLLTGV
jgi:hypothetical protein